MKTIYVYENWLSDTPSLIGRLYVDSVRGGESYSFEYDGAWLSNSAAVMLDPNLNLYGGRQYPIDKDKFGLFADSSPDRWGRVLMKRRAGFLPDCLKQKFRFSISPMVTIVLPPLPVPRLNVRLPTRTTPEMKIITFSLPLHSPTASWRSCPTTGR